MLHGGVKTCHILHSIDLLKVKRGLRGLLAGGGSNRAIEGQWGLSTSLELGVRGSRGDCRLKVRPLYCKLEHLLVHLKSSALLVKLRDVLKHILSLV